MYWLSSKDKPRALAFGSWHTCSTLPGTIKFNRATPAIFQAVETHYGQAFKRESQRRFRVVFRFNPPPSSSFPNDRPGNHVLDARALAKFATPEFLSRFLPQLIPSNSTLGSQLPSPPSAPTTFASSSLVSMRSCGLVAQLSSPLRHTSRQCWSPASGSRTSSAEVTSA